MGKEAARADGPEASLVPARPFSIVIAEKLVNRKATKRAKQLGLRYNYLLVHPSWMASRDRKRRDASEMASTGVKFHFDEEGNPVETEAFQALQLLSQKRCEAAKRELEAAFAEPSETEEDEREGGAAGDVSDDDE